MPRASLASPTWSGPSLGTVCGLTLAAAIAWFQPFDRIFAASTFGEPPIRAGLIVVLALAGAQAARDLGLQITPSRRPASFGATLLLGGAVGLLCVGLDLAFRARLGAGYVHGLVDTPLALRVAVFLAHVFNEEVLYRLFLGSVLAWAFARHRVGPARTWAIWCGFCLAQAVNVAVNVLSRTATGPVDLGYDALRFYAPGLVWSWLYVRRGFLAAVVGHMGAQLVFQALIGLALAGGAAA